MTLDEARDAIGQSVVYARPYGAREDGVITSVSSRFVFVRYGATVYGKATAAADLTFLSPTPGSAS